MLLVWQRQRLRKNKIAPRPAACLPACLPLLWNHTPSAWTFSLSQESCLYSSSISLHSAFSFSNHCFKKLLFHNSLWSLFFNISWLFWLSIAVLKAFLLTLLFFSEPHLNAIHSEKILLLASQLKGGKKMKASRSYDPWVYVPKAYCSVTE